MVDEAMELFWEDLDSGEVHIRDKWQFSLKSEFFPHIGLKPSEYTQEFYLFIPNSLQVDSRTYSKNEFYLDETNLIRYKTPEFSFDELTNVHDNRSPLTRVMALCRQKDNEENRKHLSDELKLLANVVRSLLRREVKQMILTLQKEPKTPVSSYLSNCTHKLCSDIRSLRALYKQTEAVYLENWKDPLFYRQLLYIDEFLSDSITYYLTGLLENIRLIGHESYKLVDDELCELLLEEKEIGDTFVKKSSMESIENNGAEAEGILYRFGLLNKFVLDALLLPINRFSSEQHYQERYQQWIGGLSAAVAMFLYFSLFVWLGNVFVINSSPFILLMIIVYVLKDRLKEWLRSFSYLQASRWFPDYTTVVRSPSRKNELGTIEESFSFVELARLPKEIKEIRNREFHTVLEEYQRPENIIFYKRTVRMNAPIAVGARRYGLNIIFRFNIHRFLYKAADPSETHLIIDSATRKLTPVRLPKVYHLNLIIASRAIESDDRSKKETLVQFKKLRLVIDKNGIKRIEQLKTPLL
ncbi:MAG: hypothetical protein WCG42_02865 [Parachlamydiaceae bacterium]